MPRIVASRDEEAQDRLNRLTGAVGHDCSLPTDPR